MTNHLESKAGTGLFPSYRSSRHWQTSQALQFLVREQLAEKPKVQSSKFKVQSSILLLAYTNRAVDEICNMLTENELDYIRIGNEFSCDPKYSDHLLKEVLDDNATLNSIKSTIADARIVVATTSTMNSNAALFNIKHFDLAIIDEASQILEPKYYWFTYGPTCRKALR